MAANQDRLNLVFGASGYIGSNLVEHLLAAGKPVRACSRNRRVLQGRGWEGAELCQADALDPASLDEALQNVDTAYYLVHSMAAGKDFPAIDAVAARNFAAAAERQQLRRIVYLGGLTPDNPRSAHLQSREETGDILRSGTVPVTELRAGMIIGPGSAAWEVIRDLVNHLPVMLTPRWVFSRSTPIALSNLLHYLAEVPSLEATAGETYEVASMAPMNYKEIMLRYGKLVGKRPLIIPVPVLTPRLSSYWLRLITAVPTNLARALIDGLSQDVIAHDQRLQQLIPQALVDFDAAAEEALVASRQHDLPAHWVTSALPVRSFDSAYSFYAKQAAGSALTSARTADIWSTILSIGNGGDFFYARPLWWLRRAFDWAIGGPSFRRRRRDPLSLRLGDVLDSWRVIAIEPEKKLTLLMEMKAPGAGVLEFEIDDAGAERRISVHAYWHPAGTWGLLYWYLVLPAHLFIFNGTAKAIAKASEAR